LEVRVAKLIIDKPWHGPKRIYQPGEYTIPHDFTHAIAKCCVVEGCGQIVTEVASAEEPFRSPPPPENEPWHKGPAPKNKSRGAAPKNKAEME
jgi:hypothetical protein